MRLTGIIDYTMDNFLCANMNGSEDDNEKIDILREAVRAERALRTTTINNIKYSIKRNAVKKENNDFAFDVTLTIIMEFNKSVITGNKFLRIDGNHRLSAVNPSSSYADKRKHVCLKN